MTERSRRSQREAELRARLESDTGLDEWLREVGPERVEASGERLGWFDGEVDDASSVQS